MAIMSGIALTVAHMSAVSSVPASAVGSPALQRFAGFLRERQSSLVKDIEAEDGGAVFKAHPWERHAEDPRDGGAGCMSVLEEGEVWEKAGVGITVTGGKLTKARARAMSERGACVHEGDRFAAAALSLVMHARSPRVPTFRADVRVFELYHDSDTTMWFGGGADLTPSYLNEVAPLP